MPGGRPTHCNEHRTADMIIVKCKRCESEACRDIQNPGNFKVDGMSLCWGCFTALHPDKAKSKVRREQVILAELERLVPELNSAFSLLWDCRVPGGCSLKKPDYLARFPDRYLQVEVDEDGHEDYNCYDEDARLEIISADVGMPGLVLRLDPDETPCFKRRRASNGEPIWCAAEPAFGHMMQRAADRVRAYLASPAPDGLVREYITASAGESSSSSST